MVEDRWEGTEGHPGSPQHREDGLARSRDMLVCFYHMCMENPSQLFILCLHFY